MENNLLNRRITNSQLLNIVLAVTLVILIGFGYLYYKKTSVVTAVQQIIPTVNSIPVPKYEFTIYGKDTDYFRNPQATVVGNNRIYVADTLNSRVMVFDYTGKYVQTIGGSGNFAGAMKGPTDIAFYNNKIYVTDYDLGKILIYTESGEFIGYFAETVTKGPSAIAVSGANIYVFDSSVQRLYILDSQGSEVKSFGGQGAEPGKFYFAKGINVDNQGNIYVADSNNFRIQVFTSQGEIKKELKSDKPDNAGGYTIPRGVAFDKRGNLWTANMLAGGVSITNPAGERLSLYTQGESAEDSITLPTEVFIDDNNRLYVTELGRSRVLVYQLN